MKKILGIFTIAFLIFACTESDDTGMTTDDAGQSPPLETFDRSAMLTNWADTIIIPGYVDFDAKVAALESASAAFNAETIDLSEIRAAWLDAYTTWQRVSMFEIGPAEDLDMRLNVNIYPAAVETIEANIASGDYDLSLSSNRTAKGFPAIDYLLYGSAATDAEILAKFRGSGSAPYKDYLSAIVGDMRLLSENVLAQWQGDYKALFVSNDGASATASTDRFVNDYIFYFERFLRAGKMGIPGGVFSGDVQVENLEAFYAGSFSKALFLEGLNAMQDFFNGRAYASNATGESLSTYLDELNAVKEGADLNAIINNQFDIARTSVEALGNFKDELATETPTDFLEAYTEVQRLVPLLKVDMVSAMSISIDFADADGD